MNFSILSVLISLCCAASSLNAEPAIFFDSQAFILVNEKKLEEHVPKFSGVIDFFLHPSLNPIEEAQKRFWKQLETNWGAQEGIDIAAMVRDQSGDRVLPKLMVRWFRGEISGQQAMTLVKRQCPVFVSDIASVAFNAELLARHSYVTPEALNFVKKCSSLEAKLFMVGNWNLEAFGLVAGKQQELLSYIPVNNRYISGVMHLVLPSDIALIFSLIAQDAQIDLTDIIFVTSMPYHERAAKHRGIKTVLVTQNNFQAAYDDIEKALNPA